MNNTGCDLESLEFYVFATIGLYVGLISYNGKMSACVVADATIKTKPNDICRHWAEQFSILEKAAALESDYHRRFLL